jgi:hypothetical protein
MAKSLTVRTLVAIGIAVLVLVWVAILHWALSHGAIPHIFELNSRIFSHVATFVEYRSAHNLVYAPTQPVPAKDPTYFKLGDLLSDWNPDDTSPSRWLASKAHPSKGNGLARFDYSDPKQREIALQYRDQELPFVVYNVPDLDKAITETFTSSKLLGNIGKGRISVERIRSNNYLYYHAKKTAVVRKRYPDWEPPQEDVEMTYPQFLTEVAAAEARPDYVNSSIPLYYFTISATEVGSTRLLFAAL